MIKKLLVTTQLRRPPRQPPTFSPRAGDDYAGESVPGQPVPTVDYQPHGILLDAEGRLLQRLIGFRA